jgi:deoxycytidine triphosphate deaminase
MSRDEERQREEDRLRQLKARQPKVDSFAGAGVVLSDGIEAYCKEFDLIAPFREINLKPANYKLSVGDEFSIGGIIRKLGPEPGHDELQVPPFEVAIIKTRETLNVPRFLIARWNIQVKRAYQGLIWVGGPQVDAGYVGHLFCPIYNLSDKPVTLKYDDTIAVIDFEKTTEFHEGGSKSYREVPELVLFDEYPTLKSALATLVTERLEAFKKDIERIDKNNKENAERLENRFNSLAVVAVGGIGILFAVLALFVTVGDPKALPVWAFSSVAFSFLALLIAVGAMKGLY